MARRVGKAEGVWRERLGRFPSSGLTIGAFCEREGVSASSFHAWKKRLGLGPATSRGLAKGGLAKGGLGSEPLFVPVSVTPRVSAGEVRIVLPGGAVVHVPPEADERVLALVIEAAARIGQEESAC
jgi:hypothetical protein